MAIKFGDLYEEMLTLEEAIYRMRIDIENTNCDTATKCLLIEELELLEHKYDNLKDTEFDFEKLNFTTIVESIERCLHCIEFDGEFTDLAPPPISVASTCGGKDEKLTLDDFEKIVIYEGTSKVTKYEFTKNAMPYTILTTANEKYVVTWDSLRGGISVKGFNQTSGRTVSNFGNISKVEVVLNEPAQKKYDKEKVMACKVLLTTPTPMSSNAPLTNAVRNNDSYPRVASTSQTEVELVFQVFV